jgi:hypothetical protein
MSMTTIQRKLEKKTPTIENRRRLRGLSPDSVEIISSEAHLTSWEMFWFSATTYGRPWATNLPLSPSRPSPSFLLLHVVFRHQNPPSPPTRTEPPPSWRGSLPDLRRLCHCQAARHRLLSVP